MTRTAQGLGRVRAGALVEPGRARAVHGGEPGAPPQRELQRRDVGEADHQLRVGPHRVEVDAVDDALRAVAAPGAQHAAHVRVAQRAG